MIITNPFTGEKRMHGKTNPKNQFEEQRALGKKHLELDQAELVEYGEPHPHTGERQTRPKSLGRVYDIPPNDGTYCPNKVDLTGAEAVDINALMKKWDPSGEQFKKAISQGWTTDAGLNYDDFTDAKTLQEALDITIHAQQQFDTLDAKIRNQFQNNPIEFLKFVNDEKTLEEQYKMGIRIKKPETPKTATLDDVVKAVQDTAKTKKQTPKGGDSEE